MISRTLGSPGQRARGKAGLRCSPSGGGSSAILGVAEPDLPQKEASEVAKGKVSMDRLALGKRLEELRGEFGFEIGRAHV